MIKKFSSLLKFAIMFSHPLAQQQIDAVDKVLSELDVSLIPKLIVWNKVHETIFIVTNLKLKNRFSLADLWNVK